MTRRCAHRASWYRTLEKRQRGGDVQFLVILWRMLRAAFTRNGGK